MYAIRFTLFDEDGIGQNFDIVTLCTYRLTYRQTDTLHHPRILISSLGDCPILVKKRVCTGTGTANCNFECEITAVDKGDSDEESGGKSSLTVRLLQP